jgi:hypothetical protein
MSWQIGLMIVMALYVVLWIFAEAAHRMGRDDDRWTDDYQWKLRRRIERNAADQRWGKR